MHVYHGSPAKFEVFDYTKVGTQGTTEGKGFYFTDTKRIAEGYGANGYLYTVEWLGKKSLSSDTFTITPEQFRKYLIELDKKTDYLSNYGEVDFEGLERVLSYAMAGDYESSENDVDLISGVINASGDIGTTVTLLHEMFGYDSIITGAEWGGEQTIYIALIHEAFRIVDVTKL